MARAATVLVPCLLALAPCTGSKAEFELQLKAREWLGDKGVELGWLAGLWPNSAERAQPRLRAKPGWSYGGFRSHIFRASHWTL